MRSASSSTRRARATSAVERAAELARRLPPFVTPVLLFVNAQRRQRSRAACAAIPDALLQFHGDETPAQCRAPPAGPTCARPGCRSTAAFDLLEFALPIRARPGPPARRPRRGLRRRRKGHSIGHVIPPSVTLPVVLSGGLHACKRDRWHRASAAALQTLAVDVSSGVESAKGIKDAAARSIGSSRPSAGRCPTRFLQVLNSDVPCRTTSNPTRAGHFGPYGGSFVAETLTHALDELRDAYAQLPATTPSSWPSSATS